MSGVPEASTELIPLEEACTLIGISRPTILRWIRQGELPAARVGGQVYLSWGDLLPLVVRFRQRRVVPPQGVDPLRAGRRIRQVREAYGWSQLALAERSGISHEAISVLERGGRLPLAATLERVATALGVSSDDLLADAEPVHPERDAELTVEVAARRLEVPASRVQRWMAAGKLPGRKVSGSWRIPREAVDDLLRRERLRGRSRRLDPRYRG
jgi:excisionase family DNA binding protein